MRNPKRPAARLPDPFLWGRPLSLLVAIAILASGCIRFGPASDDVAALNDASNDVASDISLVDQLPPDHPTSDVGHLDTDASALGPTHTWSKRFGGTGNDRGVSLVVDTQGNLYVAGVFLGAVNFGGSALPNKGAYDIFLVSFSKTGAYRWAKAFGGTGWDRLGDLGIDSKGNLYLTGYFPGTIDFGGGTLTSAGHSEIFLASFTSSGAHRWSKRFGGDRYDQAYALTVDGTDNVTICGAFQRTVSFGGASLSSAYYARYDAFLASFTSSGTHRWSKRFGESAAHEFGKHVVATAGGDVIMAGLFQHAVDFGGGALTSAGGYDIVLAGYTSSGNYRWSKRFGGAQSEGVSGLTVDTTGRAYLTGSFHDPLDLGGGMLKSAGSDDIYLASYTSKGAHRWSKRMGGVPGDYGNALAIDATGDVIITGRFGSLLDLGGGLSLKSFGANDVYVAAFSEAGVPRWARHLGGTSWDSAAAIAAGPQGALVLTGFFEKSADFGGGPMSSAGLQDIFVTRWVE